MRPWLAVIVSALMGLAWRLTERRAVPEKAPRMAATGRYPAWADLVTPERSAAPELPLEAYQGRD